MDYLACFSRTGARLCAICSYPSPATNEDLSTEITAKNDYPRIVPLWCRCAIRKWNGSDCPGTIVPPSRLGEHRLRSVRALITQFLAHLLWYVHYLVYHSTRSSRLHTARYRAWGKMEARGSRGVAYAMTGYGVIIWWGTRLVSGHAQASPTS